MNAKPDTTILPKPAEIETRIADERRRLLAEQNRQADLESQRIAPLEAGDDAALDRIEQSLLRCLETQSRIQQRIEILSRRHAESVETEREADLDAIEARANAARMEGERLIRTEYVQLAMKLAPVLKRLAVIDAMIEKDNWILDKGGRTPVRPSNATRQTPYKNITYTKKVLVNPGDDRHPQHAERRGGTESHGQDLYGIWVDRHGRKIEPVEVEVTVTDGVGGDYPGALFETVELPSAEPQPYLHSTLPAAPVPHPIFQANPPVSDEEIAECRSEFDSTRKAQTKRKSEK